MRRVLLNSFGNFRTTNDFHPADNTSRGLRGGGAAPESRRADGTIIGRRAFLFSLRRVFRRFSRALLESSSRKDKLYASTLDSRTHDLN